MRCCHVSIGDERTCSRSMRFYNGAAEEPWEVSQSNYDSFWSIVEEFNSEVFTCSQQISPLSEGFVTLFFPFWQMLCILVPPPSSFKLWFQIFSYCSHQISTLQTMTHWSMKVAMTNLTEVKILRDSTNWQWQGPARMILVALHRIRSWHWWNVLIGEKSCCPGLWTFWPMWQVSRWFWSSIKCPDIDSILAIRMQKEVWRVRVGIDFTVSYDLHWGKFGGWDVGGLS